MWEDRLAAFWRSRGGGWRGRRGWRGGRRGLRGRRRRRARRRRVRELGRRLLGRLLLLRSGLWDPRWEEGRTWLGEDGISGRGTRRGVDGGWRVEGENLLVFRWGWLLALRDPALELELFFRI